MLRWAISAALVVALHAGLVMLFVGIDHGAPIGEPPAAIVVDLAPVAAAPQVLDAAEGAPQVQAQATDLRESDRMKEDTPDPPALRETMVDVPRAAARDAALPARVSDAQPKSVATKRAAPATRAPHAPAKTAATPTAPAVGRASAAPALMASWHSRIVAQIERHKGYPREAQQRGEEGVTRLAFRIDRQGHLLSSRVVHSSGFSALDRESLATVRRAQPFPPAPPEIPGTRFDFTVPIRFSLH